MKSIVINALRNNPDVFKEFAKYVAKKSYDITKIVTSSDADTWFHMICFFNVEYHITILVTECGYDVVKNDRSIIERRYDNKSIEDIIDLSIIETIYFINKPF